MSKKPALGEDFAPPDLPCLEPAPDPYEGVTFPDDIEQSPLLELDVLKEAFRERARREAARQSSATDSGYYTCVAFETRAQCETFLAAIGVLGQADMVIDGRILAARMGIALPKGDYKGRLAKPDPKYEALARDMPKRTPRD